VKDPETFALEFSEAVKQYVEKHNYKTLADFARDVDVNPQSMRNMVNRMKFSATENFAKVYYHTGIPESDPRHLPQKNQPLPGDRGQVWVDRAWSEQKWNDRKKEYGQQFSESSEVKYEEMPAPPVIRPKQQEKDEPSQTVFASSVQKSTDFSRSQEPVQTVHQEETLGQLFGRNIDRIFEVAVRQAVGYLEKGRNTNMSSEKTRTPPSDEERIMKEFFKLLQNLAQADSHKRDEFSKNYGVLLADIWRYVDAMSLTNPKERDEALEGMREVRFQ